jgi:FtsX-like permease family
MDGGLITGTGGRPAPAVVAGRVPGARLAFVLRRARSAPLLPASLLVAVLVSVTVSTALASFEGRALPAAMHERLTRVPTATAIQISGQIGAATARTDQPVIRAAIRSALGPVPFALASALWSDQLVLPRTGAGNQTPLIQVAVLSGVTAHAVLTAGRWPSPAAPGAPTAVALPASAAATLRLPAGAELALRDSLTGALIRLRVTGLYRPRDPAAAYWRLSLLGTAGKLVQGTFVTYGPMLAAPGALGDGGLPVSDASWLVTVHSASITPGQLGPLARRLGAAVATLRSRQDMGGLQVGTGLPALLSALASSLVVARSLLFIGAVQLLLLAGAAAALAARLIISQREEETALLAARGVARAQLLRAGLAEACLLALAGAVAGLVAGAYLAALLLAASGSAVPGGANPVSVLGRGLAGWAWWPAALLVVLVVGVMMWPALRPATPGAARSRRGRPAVLATAARAGLDVAVIGLGAAALWELRRYSAVQRLAGGQAGIDPVLALAPALALAGIALLPLRVLPAAARAADRLSARSRGLNAALASWQVSRRPVRAGSPVLVVILAVAIGTLVLAQHQSWRQSQLDQTDFAVGADVRVGLTEPLTPGQGRALGARPGVRAAMPVITYDSEFTVFALDSREAAATVLLRPDLSALPAPVLWHRIRPGRTAVGLVLPGRPRRLGLGASLQPPHGRRLGTGSVTLSVQDGWGIVYSVPCGTLPADGREHELAAGLAPGGQAPRYPLRLLGVSVSYQLPGFPARSRTAAAQGALAITGLAVSGQASGGFPAPFAPGSALTRWLPGAGAAGLVGSAAHGTAPSVSGWRVSGGTAVLAFHAGAGYLIEGQGEPPLPVPGQLTVTAPGPRTPVPAIVTRAFLAASGARLGQTVPLPAGTGTVPARLVAEIRAFPTAGGGGSAVIVDQAWLQEILASRGQPPLPVTQWWLATGPGRLSGLPAGATVSSRAKAAAGLLADPVQQVPQLALLAIAAAAALLAAIGFGVSVLAAVWERRRQDALLAALGVSPSARAGQLSLEQLMLSLPGAVAGVVIGALLAWLLAPAVTLTSRGSAPFPPVRVVIPAGWTTLLALGLAAVPVVAAALAAASQPDPAAGLRAGEAG